MDQDKFWVLLKCLILPSVCNVIGSHLLLKFSLSHTSNVVPHHYSLLFQITSPTVSHFNIFLSLCTASAVEY